MRGSKGVVAAGLVVAVLAAAGVGVWYASVPHTAEQQFAYADKLEKQLRLDALSKSAADVAPELDKVVKAYEKVGTYGKSEKGAEALERIEDLQEKIAKDDGKAMSTLEELDKEYPDEEHAGFALMGEARILKAEGMDLKVGKTEEAAAKFKEAIAKLEDYRKRFEKGKDGAEALMEIGRVWMDGLGEPLIKPIETFEKVLKDYPGYEHEDEALARLGKLYSEAHDYQTATAKYQELLERFPTSKWADEATVERDKILDQEMKEHDAAAKDLEKFAKEHPDSQYAGEAQGLAKQARGEQAKEEGESYGKGRYGGVIPYDTTSDKPIPPAAMFKDFVGQKLDAEKYDLTVAFAPADHRITVDGTLKVANRGDDKTELLLMLGGELTVKKLTVDGKEAKFEHSGETLKITLPVTMKKDAEGVVGFTYTGQYSEPNPPELMAAMGAESAGRRLDKGEGESGSATKPASAPASAPAVVKRKGPEYPYNPQIGLGEYGYALSGASWYPITVLGDVFQAHVVYKITGEDEVVGEGALVKREPAKDAKGTGRFEFETKNPVFGLYFAYGPYVMSEKQVGDIHFYSYFRPEDAGKADAYIDLTDRILTFYGSKFVPFPYEKMAMVEVPLPPMLGGVGPASMMMLQDGFVERKEMPEFLLAHELAHQWFGNLIPINITDPNYNQWLSEGFATYCDALYTEHTLGAKALAMHMQRYGQLYFQFAMLAPKGKGAIRDTFPDSPLYRPVIYEKGAIVLHMLRKVMGDEKFFALMRKYVETYRDKPSTVDDFRKLANAENGESLDWFFSQWLDQAVFAHWKVDAQVGAAAGGGAGGTVKTKIKITQPDDLVKMPADITLYGEKGEKDVMANVMLDQREQEVDAETRFAPVRIVVDEDFWVLHRPGSDNEWKAAGTAGPTTTAALP
ncbi:MAG TPA: M1 family aminopeptidase [Phycisphaerae bacterium]|nr:M1 family aminopeptidase [Phycisphaerae bacterium]